MALHQITQAAGATSAALTVRVPGQQPALQRAYLKAFPTVGVNGYVTVTPVSIGGGQWKATVKVDSLSGFVVGVVLTEDTANDWADVTVT